MRDRRAGLTVTVLLGAMLLGGLLPVARAEPVDVDPVACLGPAAEAEPGTPEWTAREVANVVCASQRVVDKAQHPVAALDTSPPSKMDDLVARDVYRVPSRHDGSRFRFHQATVINRDGLEVSVELYRPCASGACSEVPAQLEAHDPPYPLVLVVPGGGRATSPGAPRGMYRWIAQGLAEAGYTTALYDVVSFHLEDGEDVLDWVLSADNPFRAEVDADHIGITGHSGGGATASRLGQLDDRFDAIVSFDRSGRYDLPEDDADITTPNLFFGGDYGIGVQPHQEPPDPASQLGDYHRLSGLGVDTMHLALRAAAHLDWSPTIPVAGNRYAEVVSFHFALAWFDRYLKGADDPAIAADAFERLTASQFDDSADVHNVSQGLFDPVQAAASADPYGGNVPYSIAGAPVADRLSFYFLSRCFLTDPASSTRVVSDDVRAGGCTPAQ